MGQHEMVASLLDETEFVLKSSLYDRHDQDISAHIDLIRGFSSYYTDDIGKGITYLRKALENLPDEDLKTRCYASGLLGAMLKRKGILDEAEIAIEQAIRLSRSIGFEPLIADTLTDRISLRISQGRLHEAFEACQEALQIDETQFSQSGKHLYTTGRVHYFLSVIHLSRFELGKAIEHVQLGLALAQKWGKVDEIAVCYSGLAQMYMEYGNSTKALRTMRKTRQIAGKISPKWEMMGNLAEARLHLSLGNIKDAVRFSQDFDFQHDQPIDYAHLSDYLFFARLYSVQGKFDKAISILDQLKAVAEPAEAVGDLIPILVTQASTLRKSGQTNKALEILADALGLAEPEKIIHPFITGGAVIKELLRKLEPGDKSYSWVNQLLAVFEGRGNDQQPTDMLELLSERELEVLQYLNTHLSSTEIARELHISANTVRFHIKNIYSKLNVNRRAEAVEKAIELGLL
jgi:LuxR family maltose regulon positive regulatory protein